MRLYRVWIRTLSRRHLPGPHAGASSDIDRLIGYLKRYGRETGVGLALVCATTIIAFQIPPFTRKAIDSLQLASEGGAAGSVAAAYDAAKGYVLAIVGLAVFGAAIRVASRILVFNAGRKIERDFRADFYTHLQSLDPQFFERHAVGDLMSRATNDLNNVRLLLGPGILSVANFSIAYVLAITMMNRISVELLIYSLLPFPLVMLLVKFYAGRLYEHSRSVQEGLSALTARVEEVLQGIGVVKAYALEGWEMGRFGELNEDYYLRSRKLVISRGLMFPLMGSLGSIGLFVVILIGGRKVIDGTMTLGQFVEFSQYLMALTWPTAAMGWVLGLFQRGRASLKRIEDIFEEKPVICDAPNPATPEGVEGRIELRSLTYSYEGERAFGLDDISLTIEPGQTVAVVGPTGSGKSTLVRLLTRLLPVDPGQIYIDGHDVRALSIDALRRAVGVVPQEAFLFSTTLRDNLLYGVDNGTALTAEDAAQAAGLHKDVEALRKGYDTVLGERGVTLSGGQRQRATLARAIAKDPPILILDDALSAVDTATEEEILGGLGKVRADRTVLVISHRLTAVADADRIYVLDHGRVVEEGTHTELVAHGGLYAKLFRQQEIARELEAM